MSVAALLLMSDGYLIVTVDIENIVDEVYVSHASCLGTARGATTNDYEPGRSYKISASYQL
ncbi:hypothetical protein HUO09_05990 [Vibrio sp. Y2-5]|uniref:hypothetical protein n=1 Tax=Vibrio sp. Y2-5 TaxID=2743977 RepID=UPI0016611EBF|nr:hypothetical protein [Vibrio sp. Y2-5]MBD0785884.1 hypothetical protein [Vibrio sp. Y2-5]